MSRPAGEIFGAAEGRDDDSVTSFKYRPWNRRGIDVESTWNRQWTSKTPDDRRRRKVEDSKDPADPVLSFESPYVVAN